MFKLKNRYSLNNIVVKIYKVFCNLYHISSQKQITTIYKKNLYDFFFLGETGKYVAIRGVVIKSRRINYRNIILGKRITFFSRVSNEYTYFKLSLGLPSLHF